MTEKRDSGKSGRIQEIHQKLAMIISVATQHAMNECLKLAGDNLSAQSMLGLKTALAGILPACSLVAITIGRCMNCNCLEKEGMCENPAGRVTQDTLFFAALLTAFAVGETQQRKSDEGNTAIVGEITIDRNVAYSALEAYEKLTGKKPDRFLSPGFLDGVREAQDNAASTVEAMMAKIQSEMRKHPKHRDDLN